MILVITGPSGSGKSELAKHLERASFCRVLEVGHVVRDLFRAREMSCTLVDFANLILTGDDPCLFVRTAVHSGDFSCKRIIVGVRHPRELEFVRGLGPRCFVIYLSANPAVRAQRKLGLEPSAAEYEYFCYRDSVEASWGLELVRSASNVHLDGAKTPTQLKRESLHALESSGFTWHA
jgi:hypothetical protein